MAPVPTTALHSDRERFEYALRAARAANDAERAAALAESTPVVAAEEAAADAVSAQAVTSEPEGTSARAAKAAEREQRREERRRVKAERATARAEAKKQRSQSREAARADREAAKQAAATTPDVEEQAEPETSRDDQTALIAAMPEHTDVVPDDVADQSSEPEPEPQTDSGATSSDDQTALIAAMPEHTEVVAAAAGPERVPERVPGQAPDDDSIVEPPPALPKVRRRKSTRNERIGVLLLGLAALGLLCSVVLAVGALLAAIEVDVDAAFAGAVSDLCDVLVGPLGGLFSFSGENAQARNDLFARGIGSMFYLAIGLFLPSVARRRDS